MHGNPGRANHFKNDKGSGQRREEHQDGDDGQKNRRRKPAGRGTAWLSTFISTSISTISRRRLLRSASTDILDDQLDVIQNAGARHIPCSCLKYIIFLWGIPE